MKISDILSSLTIHRKHDFELDSSEQSALLKLLSEAFPGYFKDRIFTKQIPTYRLVVKEKGNIIAHVGINCRIVNASKSGILNTIGIKDLCVAPAYHGRDIASHLLSMIEQEKEYVVLWLENENLTQSNSVNALNNESN